MSKVSVNHEEMMQRAISLSAKAVTEPKRFGPFGVVIVRDEDGKIIAEGINNAQETLDPSAHSEVVAIRQACRAVGKLTLEGCTLYASCEPCGMCSSLIWNTRIPRMFYGAHAADTADILDKRPMALDSAKPIAEREYKAIQTLPTLVAESEKIIRDWAAAAPDNELIQRYGKDGKPLPLST